MFSCFRCLISASFTAVIPFLIFVSCKSEKDRQPPALFSLMDARETNIHFNNEIIETENINPLQYEYSYSGGGVAIGDVNGDGLDDIFFTGNRVENKLYLNKGGLRFEDITSKAGVQGRDSWKTGATMADVNGDGLLDIYICYSGDFPEKLRLNELFINKGNDSVGNPVFIEEAKQYGLADPAFSMHAAFFDYDKDGDLDMILLNHSPIRFNDLDEAKLTYLLHQPDSLTGIKLFRNTNNFFEEVTQAAGLLNSRLNYNLGVSVTDVNNDGWPDLYVSNDYSAPDYLYINNKNGAYTDSIRSMLSKTSHFSMGNDVADINNDGWADIFTLDMLPEDNRRQKLLLASDNYEIFDMRVRIGLHAQYMINMLHINNGNGSFSEVAQLQGVSNTDWSWAPLIADFDNDGWKDLYVTNGFLRDFTNLDFLKFMGNKLRDLQGKVTKNTLLELVKSMPSSNVQNYIFKNIQGARFSDMSEHWGFRESSNSNGAAYGDLDNDGDLDIVVNNINAPCFVYRNNAERLRHHNYLRIRLSGEKGNTLGVGAKVYIFHGEQQQVQEQVVSKGFQSSVSPVLIFGTGESAKIDSLKITWASGKEERWINLQANQEILAYESNASTPLKSENDAYTPMVEATPSPIAFKHRENIVNDFKRQPLLINTLSYSGPCIAEADVNGDGKKDLFIGGASGQPSEIFLQSSNGSFSRSRQVSISTDSICEDVSAIFLDVDNDGDQDLLVGSGGYDHFMPEDPSLQSRLYLNNGKGIFEKASKALPLMNTAVGCAAVGDINGDGAPDLFIGGRSRPGRYPEPPASFILLNDGKGNFSDVTMSVAPSMARAGMFTDAVFCDMNNDGQPDLVTVGEWMPVKVWINNKGILEDKTSEYFDKEYTGWWNKLLVDDLNGDGKPDLVVGNYGLNMQSKADDEHPLELYYKDFDDNGSVDPIFCFYIQGKTYPYVSRDELLDQISSMRRKFPDYKSYADAQLNAIFTPDQLKGAAHLSVNTLQTMCFLSAANNYYEAKELPIEAQYSPVFAILLTDINNDGKKDLLLGGNISYSRVKFGLNQSNYGMAFTGDGKGNFSYIPQAISGFNVSGDTRFISSLSDKLILFGRNNNSIQAYKIK